MARRRLPVGRLTAATAAIVGIILLTRTGATPRFRTLRPGVDFAILRGEPYCRRGSSDIAVLRLDPSKVRLRVSHYTGQPDHLPLDILEWQRRSEALAVFNAGQYYPDYSYMGLLVSGDSLISPRPHAGFKGMLVAGPKTGGLGARVLDLDETPINPTALPWEEAAQSFMLFDRHGQTRVRKSPQIANRTAVAEDRAGHVLVITTEGGYTLYEFAGLLRTSPLGLTHAMSMDGGDEAELCVRVGEFRYASWGHWQNDGRVPNPHYNTVPLPAVVTVSLR